MSAKSLRGEQGDTQGPVPIPRFVPAPGLTLTLILLVHVSHTHIATLAAQSREPPRRARQVVDIEPQDTGERMMDGGTDR